MSLRRWARFATVGVANTVIDFGLFNAFLLFTGIHPVLASVSATSLAILTAFILHREWTFQSSTNRGRPTHQLIKFLIVGVAGLCLHAIVFNLTLTAADHLLKISVPPLMSNVLRVPAIVGMMLWNYNLYRVWVFSESRTTKSNYPSS